jgi:hypothetical protein
MRRYVELIILYNLSPYTSFLVRRKYSYTCSALKNNQRQQFSAQTKKPCLFRLFRHNLQKAVTVLRMWCLKSNICLRIEEEVSDSTFPIKP